jgi:general secretion pathway protein K
VAASQGLAKVSNGSVSGGGGGAGGGDNGGGGGTGDTTGGGDVGGGGDTGGGGGGGTGGGGTQSGQAQPTVMRLVQLDDLLAIPGWTPELVEKLRPFAIVLPQNTPVNVNTAPAEVLSALAPGLSLMTANSLVARRKQAPYKDIGQFTAEALQGQGSQLPTQASVRSDWFLVESHIKLDRATLNVEALVSRVTQPAIRQLGPHVVWIRQI